MLFSSALSAAEAEGYYEAARSGRLLHEHPALLAMWHPLIADRAAGTCVAATSEGPWVARPRSEAISVVEIVPARESAGGMLNLLLPLVELRSQPFVSGDMMVAASLRLLTLLIRSHPRNQAEARRSQAMLLLGHLVSCLSAANLGEAAVAALADLAEAAREDAGLFLVTLDQVVLRFDAWRRLELHVQAALLKLINALAVSDEAAAHSVGLPQRLLDAGRKYFLRAGSTRRSPTRLGAAIPAAAADSLHGQCLSAAALVGSDRLACHGALPLLAHALAFGARCRGPELEAQAAALALLLRLADTHGPCVLEPLHHHGGMLALVEALHQRHSPSVTLLAARLVCAPLTMRSSSSYNLSASGQWCDWMTKQGLSVVRLALVALPADEALFTALACMLLGCPEHDVDSLATPKIHTPQLLPALLAASARAPLELQARQLERLSLWLRLCPANCAALTATAPLWQPHAAAVIAATLNDESLSALTSATAMNGSIGRKGGDEVGLSSLCLTYMIELLCTYVVEALAVDLHPHATEQQAPPPGGEQPLMGDGGSVWPALDIAIVVTAGCGPPAQVHHARHLLLERLLLSLTRLGPRFANDAVACPSLLRLCVIVRAHVMLPPPPPPPVAVTIKGLPPDRPEAAVRLRLSTRGKYEPASLSSSARWRAAHERRGEDHVNADATLLLLLFGAFDAFSVRAMMDDATDAALRRKYSPASLAAPLRRSPWWHSGVATRFRCRVA